MSVVKRFEAGVVRGPPAACWDWQRGQDGKGYGAMKIGGRTERTHRLAWVLANGAIPESLCVLHRCDNPRCCNPAHLFLGTRADNNADKIAKGRAVNLEGERHGNAKLTDESVRAIRRRYTGKRGELASLGREFGVTTVAIRDIVLGRRRRSAGEL